MELLIIQFPIYAYTNAKEGIKVTDSSTNLALEYESQNAKEQQHNQWHKDEHSTASEVNPGKEWLAFKSLDDC